MRVVERLARRERTWRELDALLSRFERAGLLRGRRRPEPDVDLEPGEPVLEADADPVSPAPEGPRPGLLPSDDGRVGAAEVLRLGELYRAACADLMLAEAYDLPRDTVAYLHALVGRAHNALYRSRGFRFRTWAAELFETVPRRLRTDPTLRLSGVIFFGTMLIVGCLSAARPDFAEAIAGPEYLTMMEEMYAEPVGAHPGRDDAMMTGFYINNNAGIGLTCYGAGLTFGLGTLWILLSNAMMIGSAFGHMAVTPYAMNFYGFVTAHGPFELTAIVFSGAAGLRLGWGLIDTKGQRRVDSLRREALASLPIAGSAVFLFVLAAFLEGFVSASPLPYIAKASIAVASALLLILYVALGGRGSRPARSDDRS